LGAFIGLNCSKEKKASFKGVENISYRDNFQVVHPRYVCSTNIKLKYRQIVNTQQNLFEEKKQIIDYMFRPFFIRPSSGLAWRSKEELVQLYEVQRYIMG
jgi:hypothetical protein